MKYELSFRGLALVLVLLLAWGVCVMPVGAQSGADDSPLPTPTPTMTPGSDDAAVAPPSLPEFLEQLAGPGGALMIGVLLSVLQARWPWFQALPTQQKGWLSVALSVGIPLIARVLLLYVPGAVWTALAPLWVTLALAVSGYLGNQGWYQMVVKPNRQREQNAALTSSPF